MRIRNCDDHDPGGDNDDDNEGIDLGEDDNYDDHEELDLGEDNDDDIEDLGEQSGTVNDKGNLNHHCCA